MKPFEIKKEDIERLYPHELPFILQKLLRAELSKLNLKQSELSVSLDITDPDGGLDGYIGVDIPNNHPWLPTGKSGWQFKAIHKFGSYEAKTHFLNKKKTAIKPRIIKLLEKGEAYALVISGKDFQPDEYEEIIKKEFFLRGYPGIVVKVFSSGQITEWINTIPSVATILKKDRAYFKDIDEWYNTSRVLKEPPKYCSDSSRDGMMESIRNKIISNYNGQLASIVRIVGLTGVGKTRFIFETLNIEKLKDLVLYVESPDKLPKSRFNEIAQDKNVSGIFIVDECPHDSFIDLAKEVEGIGGRIALISLDFDIDKVRDTRDEHFIISKLQDESVDRMIQNIAPGLPPTARRKIVEFSEGYPRTAIQVAQNFYQQPELLSADNLSKLGFDDLFEKMIAGRYISADTRKIKRLLTALSLFKRVGWDEDLADQGIKICNLFSIDWNEARELVKEQEERGLIVKKGRYRYISPLPLSVYLASKWWETWELNECIKFFGNLQNDELHRAFLQKLKDIPFAKGANKLIEKLFAEYDYGRLNTVEGSQIFFYLTQTDHNIAYLTLERILSRKTHEELINFGDGRRYTVWALEIIVRWSDTFTGATKILLQLAEAEIETISNNATGIFAQLFQINLGGTSVPVWDRHYIIRDALDSDNKNIQKLALKGLDSTLNLGPVARFGSAELQGTIILPEDWHPTSKEDFIKSVKSGLVLLKKAMEIPNKEINQEAVEIFLRHVRMLQRGFFTEVIERLKYIHQNSPFLERELIATVEDIIRFDKERLPEENFNQILNLRDDIYGPGFKGKMKQYVWNPLSREYYSDNREEYEDTLKALAEESIGSPELLIGELSWLLTPEAENGYLFGKFLGVVDTDFSLFDIIWKALHDTNNPSVYFLSGYLDTLKIRNISLWEEIIHRFRSDSKLKSFTLEVLWRSGSGDKAADILIDMLQRTEIHPSQIYLLIYGAWFNGISEQKFGHFLYVFYDIDEEHLLTILGIIDQFSKTHPRFVASQKSIIRKFLKNIETSPIIQQMEFFHWSNVTDQMINANKDNANSILIIILNVLKKHISIKYNREIRELIRNILKKDPKRAWDKISRSILKAGKIRYNLIEIIKGEYPYMKNEKNSLFDVIPEQELWIWVENNKSVAPYLLAEMTPIHESDDCLHPIAKRLLKTFSDDERIERILSRNWDTEALSGPFSLHYEQKLLIAEKWLNDDEASVKSFAHKEIQKLKKLIESEKREEEEERILLG